MSEITKRINIIIRPDGLLTASTEGMHGGECLPYMDLVFNALDAVPLVPMDQAAELLSEDYYNELHNNTQETQRSRQKNYVFE